MLLELRKASPKDVRKNKMVPGVIYGKSFEPISIKVDERTLHTAYSQYGKSMTFNVQLEGQTHLVYIKDAQFELFNNSQITHFDLVKITGETLITADIPVIVHGRENVESQNLFVEIVMQTITARYPADNAIGSFEFDITDFEVNQAIFIKDLKVDDKIEVLADEEQMILIVKEPVVIEEVVPDEEEAITSEYLEETQE